jgi:hypothetical protein
MAGLYIILKKVGNAFWIDLLPLIKIHFIISVDKLYKAANDLLPGQLQELALLIIVNGQNKWDVDEVLASRGHFGKLQYCVKWVNSELDPVWYPVSDFIGCLHKLKEFHEQNLTLLGLPCYLTGWLWAWEDSMDEPEYYNDEDKLPWSSWASSTRRGG